ncbi:hypothetical protein GGF43_000423 [Coemansia sp. RSA 2618]|nr:hypothetical protein GGF43_000423 [Coemansia sp. RSA 2618]
MSDFGVNHQLVSLDIDFERQVVRGITELTVEPRVADLRVLYLHCERPVWVNGKTAEFRRQQVKTRQELVHKLLRANEDIHDTGDLEITVPANQTGTLKVRIEYYVVRPQSGLVLRGDVAYTETRVYPSSARQWVPCLDVMGERSTWDLFFVVPVSSSSNGDAVTAIASGELSSVVAHPRNAARRVVRYIVSTATAACTLGFAVGPFTGACALDGAEEVGGVFAFASAGRAGEAQATCAVVPEALEFYAREFGAYPFATYKVVFVEGLMGVVTCAALTLVGADVLHGTREIEEAYEARRVLGLAVARQWFGAFVGAAGWGDQWLVAGLAGFMAAQFVRHHLGANEQRYRLKRDMARVCHADVNQKPLSYAGQGPWAGGEAAFAEVKAPVVLYMLDRRMVKGGVAVGLQRVVPGVLVAATGGAAVDTAGFLRTCRRVSGVDASAFAAQWVFASGCPVFHVGYEFNRKKLVVEITLHQESTNARATAPWARAQLFAGQMTARIREADGTPYEHVLDIRREHVTRFEVQFNTKYKRIRRSTRRFHMRQMAAAAEELNINEMLGLDDEDDSNIALFGAENAREKRDWRVVEWGEDDEESLASATFEWIRMDSDLEWACVMHFKQYDFMWAAQLQKDRDVVAQLDAVDALQHLPSAAAATTLMRTVMDARVFYRVRADAALALARLATPELAWIGLHHLAKIYKRRFCLPPHAGDQSSGVEDIAAPRTGEQIADADAEDIAAPRLPRPNNFANIGEYFTQLAVAAALSNVRDRHGEAPLPARRLLLAAACYNDNSENVFSDARFLAALVRMLANSVVASTRFERYAVGADDAVLREIERLRRADALVPSAHSVVTCACLDALTRLSVVQRAHALFNPLLFCAMADARAGASVREHAVGALLLHWGLGDQRAARYFAAVASDERSSRVAATCARFVLALSVVRAMAFGKQHNSLLFQEQTQGAAPEHIDTDARLVGGLESFIDSLGDSRALQTVLASAVHDSALSEPARSLLGLLHMLVYQVMDSSVPPPTAGQRKKLKIKLGSRRRKQQQQQQLLQSQLQHPAKSTASSDSEDTPLALGVADRDEYVDIGDSYALPPIAGTRPPALVVPDDRMHSPAYEPPQPAQAAKEEAEREPIKVKLKLKLGKPRSPSVSTLPRISSPLAHAPELKSPEPKKAELIKSPKATPKPPKPPRAKLAPAKTPEPTAASSGLTAEQRKAVHRVLRKLARHPSAFPFMVPVDVVRDGCPTYYDVVSEPMDLGTVRRKLDENKYASVSEIERDVRLVFSNCYLFNPPQTPVNNMGKDVESAFNAEWEKCGLSSASASSSLAAVDAPAAETPGKNTPSASEAIAATPPTATKNKRPGGESPGEPKKSRRPAKKNKKAQQQQDALDDPDAIMAYLDQQTGEGDWHHMCRRVLLQLQAHASALEFMAPVDPVKQGVPTYFDVVKQPMDLGTIRRQLDRSHYRSAAQFRDDVSLVLSNCFLFNPPDSFVHAQALALKQVFQRVWRQQTGVGVDQPIERLPADLPMDEKAVERARAIINKLKRDEAAWPFLRPVDPIALGVPTYFDIVKNPMDLSTIQKKLAKKAYTCVADFVADIQLVIDDCFMFNLPDTPVNECGKALQALASKLLQPDHWDQWLARP